MIEIKRPAVYFDITPTISHTFGQSLHMYTKSSHAYYFGKFKVRRDLRKFNQSWRSNPYVRITRQPKNRTIEQTFPTPTLDLDTLFCVCSGVGIALTVIGQLISIMGFLRFK